MKTLRLILLGAVFAELLLGMSVQAQVNARRITRRVAPQPATAAGKTNAAPQVTAVAPPVPAVVAKPVATQAMVRVIQPTVDPEKARVAKEEAVRRTIEFQKKRADEGSESAQYELGVRYLKGDGLEKDDALARKWLNLSSKAGYGPATKKLEDLDRPPQAAGSDEKAGSSVSPTDK